MDKTIDIDTIELSNQIERLSRLEKKIDSAQLENDTWLGEGWGRVFDGIGNTRSGIRERRKSIRELVQVTKALLESAKAYETRDKTIALGLAFGGLNESK